MKLKTLLLTAAIAGSAMFGVASQASANAGAYMFGYTYSPNDFGVQQLIINGSTVINASNTGWYDYTGTHAASNPDYIVGDCSIGTCGGVGAYNNFFVFDLSGVSGPITSAQLSLGNPSTNPGYSGVPNSTYTNYDVSTPIASLIADASGAIGTYNDLGSGVVFATTGVSATDNGTQVIISLDGDALTSLNNAEGGEWAVGGSLGSFVAPGVPEPATWAMMLVGFGGLGASMRLARRQSASAVA